MLGHILRSDHNPWFHGVLSFRTSCIFKSWTSYAIDDDTVPALLMIASMVLVVEWAIDKALRAMVEVGLIVSEKGYSCSSSGGENDQT